MLSLDGQDYSAAQQKIERLREHKETDAFGQIAKGNVWYQTAKPDVKPKVWWCCNGHGEIWCCLLCDLQPF